MPKSDEVAMFAAYSFQWAYRHLDGLLAVPAITSDPLATSGSFMASTVLRPLATELALKVLYMHETGDDPIHEHNLKILFQGLKPTTQASVEQRFERIRQDKIARGIYSGETDPLSQVLANHMNDFIEWRYIHEKLGVGTETKTHGT